MKEKPHHVHCFHQKLCSVWFSWILVNGGLKSLTLLSSDWWSKWHEDDSITKIYEHHEHTMDHGIMRNANGMLMCSSSSVSEMYLQHSKWKEQRYLILWGYGYLNWGPLSILKEMDIMFAKKLLKMVDAWWRERRKEAINMFTFTARKAVLNCIS